MEPALLSISIVIFRPDSVVLAATIATLARSLREAKIEGELYIVDNTPADEGNTLTDSSALAEALDAFAGVKPLKGHGNVGYGRGHNLVIDQVTSSYHLILNPDVEMSPDCLVHAFSYLQQHTEVGAVSPRITGPDGQLQYLCRRSPTLWRLFLRGFAPGWFKHQFQSELDRYEMKAEIDAGTTFIDPPMISGCFMLFRTAVLRQLSGFDARFFLYFEDYDLSIRARRVAHLAYVPEIRIMHRGGHAARKGWRHTLMFIRSAALFFSIHGWRLC